MSLKISTDDKGVKVCRQDKTSQSGKAYTQYSLCVSSKNMDDTWVNGFVDCQFKKGVEVANKSIIKIKNAFYIVNEYNDKKYYKIMITDFEVLESGEAPANAVTTDADGFMNVPEGMDEELPFM